MWSDSTLNTNFIFIHIDLVYLTKVWTYQRGNQNPYIEGGQTTQWSKERGLKEKQRSTKHSYKTKDRVTQTLLRTGGELRCSGRVRVRVRKAWRCQMG